MTKLLIVSAVLIMLTGCGSGQSPQTNKNELQIHCLNGVAHYMSSEFAGYSGYGYRAAKFKRDGSVATCDE